MAKFKKIMVIVIKILQIFGIGLGTAAVTDPSALSGLVSPEHVSALAGVAAVVNAFLPSVIQKGEGQNKQQPQ